MGCNCIVVWDPLRECHAWLRGSFGDCEHPETGARAADLSDAGGRVEP